MNVFGPQRRFRPIVLMALLAGVMVGLALIRASSRPSDTPPPVKELAADMNNLDGLWLFRTDPEDIGERAGWHKADFVETGWRTLKVPDYWEPQGVTDPRPGMPPKPRVGVAWTDYDGVAWYRKRFIVPRSWAGKPLILQLGSVDDADRTFVNGVLVGETPITEMQSVLIHRAYKVPPSVIRPGAVNVVAVKVTDGGGPGGLMGPNVCLVPEKMLSGPVHIPGDDRPLAERFANPPARARILKIIHSWPDKPNEQDMLIRMLAAQGFGGVVCNVSFDRYLQSEDHWRAFVRAVREAKKAGMALWLYDEKGYPSGTAGGLTLQGHPEWQARGLLIADAWTDGGPVDIEAPPGRLVFASAVPVANGIPDLSRLVRLTPDGGRVRWTPPSGRWHVMVITEDRLYEGTHAANSLGDRQPYINLLEPEPTARFLQLTHEAYASHLGKDLGKYFISTFTDEPSLMSLFLRRMPYRVLPWSRNFAAEFRKRRGYDVMPVLPLVVDGEGGRAARARCDFWLTVAELVSENYFGQIQRWCHAHNFRSGGHPLLEEGLTGHVPLYGDFFRCARRLDAPSIDCLTSIPSEVPWHIAKMMGSIADLEGRTVTMCETSDFSQVYRPEGDNRPLRVVTEAEIRGTCNRLIAGGINTITSYYRFLDLSGSQLRALNEYVGRCCTMLTGGHQVADIAMLYPIESTWVRFVPSRHMTSEAAMASRVEACFKNASETLYRSCRDFTYVDSRAILDSTVEKGSLVHGKLQWRVVVLPRGDTLPLAAWRKLDAFVQSGGVLIAIGALPANSEKEFPSRTVRQIADRIFGKGEGILQKRQAGGGIGLFLPDGSEHLLPYALNSILERDVTTKDDAAPLRVTHRSIAGREVYFVINDSDKPWKGVVRISATGAGQGWDPLTGKRFAITDPGRVALDLQAYSGVILTFARARSPRLIKTPVAVADALVFRTLAPTGMAHGGGEFVQRTVEETPAPGDPRNNGWRALGVLTKSEVDTHLFLVLHYAPELDLSRDAFLRVPVFIPPGQPTAPQLLVILTDRRGVQYWAETGVSLAAPGRLDIVLPLSAFAHAPFSSGPAGDLDWKAITDISVGWGGHFGKEGDRIEFTAGPPAAGRPR